MTARTTRAVRIAAGSTAAALAMCTVSLVGTANAAATETTAPAVPAATGTPVGTEPAVTPAPRADQRIGGADRYKTASEIASRLAEGRNVNSLIVASGEPGSDGVDALSANFLAGALAGSGSTTANVSPVPVLLTQQAALPAATSDSIMGLLQARKAPTAAANIYVIGGVNAVSEAAYGQIEKAAKDSGADVTVTRLAGADRYATAAMVATDAAAGDAGTYYAASGTAAEKTAFVGSGLSTADALSAGPIAYRNNFPVLLTRRYSVPQPTLKALKDGGVKNVILLGDTTVTAAAVVAQLEVNGQTVTRVAGADRYATNTDLYNFATTPKGTVADKATMRPGLGYPKPVTPLLANGLGFADALTAGPLAAEGTNQASGALAANSPLLLTSPKALSTPTSEYITTNRGTVSSVTGVGLMTALPESVLKAANDAAQTK